jgi:hypothetical protein
MANASFGDAARDNLRTLVTTVGRQIARLPAAGKDIAAADDLHASWTELVKQLDLGPRPETRECPTCHGVGMRAASRCSHCWAKLEPLAASPAHAPATTVPAASAPSATVDAPRSDA